MKKLLFVLLSMLLMAGCEYQEVDIFGEVQDLYPEKAVRDSIRSFFSQTQKSSFQSIGTMAIAGSQAEKAFRMIELKKYVFLEDTTNLMRVDISVDSISRKQVAHVRGSIKFPNNDANKPLQLSFDKLNAKLVLENRGWLFSEFYIENSTKKKHPNFLF